MKANTPDHEYLRALAFSAFSLAGGEIQQVQVEHIVKGIDYWIKEGKFKQEDRERLIKDNTASLFAETSFQPPALLSLIDRTLNLFDSERALLEKIPVGVISTFEVNSFAIRTPSGGSAIAINGGLWGYLRVLYYCIGAIEMRQSPIGFGKHHSDETYIRNIFTIIECIISNALMIFVSDSEHSIADVIDFKSNPIDSVVHELDVTIIFILLHEYGHILGGHLNSVSTKKSMVGNEEAVKYETSHSQEFQADQFAAQMVWRTDSLAAMDNILTYMAISKFFFILHLCEILKDQSEVKSHPLALDRLDEIVNLWGAKTPNSHFIETINFTFQGYRKILNRVLELRELTHPK